MQVLVGNCNHGCAVILNCVIALPTYAAIRRPSSPSLTQLLLRVQNWSSRCLKVAA